MLVNLFNKTSVVINADSMQVYRYMDIGTAKPTEELLRDIPHELIGVVDPSYQFNAGEFVRRADQLIEKNYNRDRLSVISGGTAFYLKNFIYGLPGTPVGRFSERIRLKNRLKNEGKENLLAELERIDPKASLKIDSNDVNRIIRALEVYKASGRPVSSFRMPSKPRDRYRFFLVGLYRQREDLYQRINLRVETMFLRGLVDEIKKLLAMGYGPEAPGMKGIGYREFFEMRKGCLNLSDVKEIIKRNTKRYAKRQITFFRTLEDVKWCSPDDILLIKGYIDKFIQKD